MHLARGKKYYWFRMICCLAGASYYAWTHGYGDYFIVFVISFYMLGAFILWDSFVEPLFPKRKLRLAPAALPSIRTFTR
jgi:hypothetical protein